MIYAIISFGLNIICDILPFVVCLDSRFIEIATFDLVYRFQKEQEHNNDLENQLLLQGQQEQIKEIHKKQIDAEIEQEMKKLEDKQFTDPLNSTSISNNLARFMLV
jgi:hypothetical protein